MCDSSKKQAVPAKSPRLHAAADHTASRPVYHSPCNNYVSRHLSPRSDTVAPPTNRPYSLDFHTQRDFPSAASGWRPPHQVHQSVVNAASTAFIPPQVPWGGDDRRVTNGWNHVSPMMPATAGSDDWRCFQSGYPVDQYTSPDISFHHTASFGQNSAHHDQLGRWTNGQWHSGQMNGYDYSGQQRHQENEWIPVSRRPHRYQRSRHHRSRGSRTRASANRNCHY